MQAGEREHTPLGHLDLLAVDGELDHLDVGRGGLSGASGRREGGRGMAREHLDTPQRSKRGAQQHGGPGAVGGMAVGMGTGTGVGVDGAAQGPGSLQQSGRVRRAAHGEISNSPANPSAAAGMPPCRAAGRGQTCNLKPDAASRGARKHSRPRPPPSPPPDQPRRDAPGLGRSRAPRTSGDLAAARGVGRCLAATSTPRTSTPLPGRPDADGGETDARRSLLDAPPPPSVPPAPPPTRPAVASPRRGDGHGHGLHQQRTRRWQRERVN